MIRFIKKYEHIIVSSILFLVTLATAITTLFAWFINNERSAAGGIDVSSDNTSVEIREVINVKRYFAGDLFSDKNFHRFTDGYYYEYDMENEEYVLSSGNKIPMTFNSIYPTEIIDITMWYRLTGESDVDDYSLYLTNFDDTNGKFYNTDNNDVSYEHTVRGIFRTGEVKEEMSYNWLGTDTNYDKVLIKAGKFSTDVKETYDLKMYCKTTFRIELSLDQYYAKLHAATNALSEKILLIGAIRIIA